MPKKSFVNPTFQYSLELGEDTGTPLLNETDTENDKKSDIRVSIGLVSFLAICTIIYFTTVQPVKPISSTPSRKLKQTVIKDVAELSSSEKDAVLNGFISMKSCTSKYDKKYNAYDYFVKLHNLATLPNTEIHGSGYLFFPWHREMQNRFHKELQRCSKNPNLFVPYYDHENPDSKASVMSIDYLGADGNPSNGYIVEKGLLGSENNKWIINEKLRLPFATDHLRRAIGHGLQMCLEIGTSCTEEEADDGSGKCENYFLDTPLNPPTVDNQETVTGFLKLPKNADPAAPPLTNTFEPEDGNQDCSWEDRDCFRYYQEINGGDLRMKCKHFAPSPEPYSKCSQLTAFLPENGDDVFVDPNEKNEWVPPASYGNAKPDTHWAACIEGNDPDDMYAAGLERIGASLHTHGSVHTSIGGSLATPYSPNDPMFAHLHGNVDRLWALYQEKHGNSWFETTAKAKLDLPMPLFKNPTVTIRDVLDINNMPFRYAKND